MSYFESLKLEESQGGLPEPLDLIELTEKAKELSVEQVREKVARLNLKAQLGKTSHEIKVAVDPSIQTWACARIPKKEILRDGTVVESSSNYFYVIVMPYGHLAIEDERFLLGEVYHELGHALYTDWKMTARLSELCEKEGYNKRSMGNLTNCLEDPRMEHTSVYHTSTHGFIKDLFWQKNKKLILGNIGGGIAEMDPVSQFDFLIKLVSLWALHEKNAKAEGIEKWDDWESIHPDAKEAFMKIKGDLEKICGYGKYKSPEMISGVLERTIKNVLWPAKKELIDKHGEQKEPPEMMLEGEWPVDDPSVIDNLPPELQQVINQQFQQYTQKIEKDGEEQKKRNEEAEAANKKIEEEKNERAEKEDGIKDPDARKKYNKLVREAAPVVGGMKRIFAKYFPKVAFPREIHSMRGKEPDIQRKIKTHKSGEKKIMKKPNIPEKSGLVLQVIIDKSGSMGGERIHQVVRTVVGILEATSDYPIYVEILASDDQHGGINESYIIKDFDEEFSGYAGGKIKERLVNLMESCSAGNEDAASLKWAVPRLVAQKNKVKGLYEKISALCVFLSDAEIEGQQDPLIVNELRKKVPIIGGVVDPNPAIKTAVEKAYG
ncbi:hypothetical protein GF340_04310, partial [Candidatus Peregrinibacteria bacterium]|nr:hypothetical protein [Candidatus Peregrinibacteria bacterium]